MPKDLTDWTANITYTDELPKKGKTVLVIGESGMGKTRLCGSAPAPFVIDLDKGLETLRELHVPHLTISFDTANVMELLITIIRDYRDRTGEFGPEGKFKDRKTLCIDSLAALNSFVKTEITARIAGGPKDAKRKLNPIWDKMEIDHWNVLSNYYTFITSMLQDVATHSNVIVTATPWVKEDPNIKRTRLLPAVDGRFKGDVARYYDYVFNLTMEDKVYSCYTIPFKQAIGKTRSSLPEKIILSGKPNAWEAIFGEAPH